MAGLRTVGVKLAAEVSGYVNSMRTAGGATRDFVGNLDKAAKAGHLDAVANQAGRMGLGLVAAFGVAVGAAAKFDKQMSEVGAVASASATDLERLRQAALQAGKDTSFSATQAAQAEAELAKAGLDTAAILGGALKGSLSLAAAGSIDLAESADIAAKTMNVFGLEGADVGHIADVLAASANKSATDVHEMGEALKMGGLAANAAGMSMEETVGTLAAFADRALNGSDAGTSLKTSIMMLQAPSEKSKALMEKLGIAAYDSGGNFVGTARLAGNLQDALGGLTQEQRNAALATIFGADGMRAANILYTVGEQGIRDYIAAVDDQGAAAATAAAKTDNLMGDIERLTGSLETLAIESASTSSGGLRTIVQSADNLVSSLSSIPGPIQNTVVAVAGIGGAVLLAAAGMVKLKSATAPAVEELRKTGPAGVRAADGLEKTSKWAGRATVALVALQVGGAVLSSFMDELNPQIEATVGGLKEWNRQGELAGEAARLFGKDAEDLSRSLSGTATNGFSQFMDGITDFIFGIGGVSSPLDDAKERVQAFDASLSQMVQSGNADQAGKIVEEMAKRANVSVEDALKVLPEYAGAVENAGRASETAAGGVGAVGEAAKQAAEEVEKLNDAFDELFGIEMGLDQATLKYKQGLVDLKAEMVDGALTLNTNTEEGRNNTEAVLEQISKIKALRDARYEHGMVLDEANGKYVKDIDGLRASMLQAGYTETAVDALIGKYAAIPASVNTTVAASTGGATNALSGFEKKINTIDGRTITVYARFTPQGNLYIPGQGTQVRRWGGITQHAQDGLLRDAAVYSPQGPARYAFAEPATGGEAFIPRFGDTDRSLGILDRAAGWYGKTLANRTPTYTTGSGGAITVNVRVDGSVVVEGTGVLQGLRKEVRIGGGNVQAVLGPKGREAG